MHNELNEQNTSITRREINDNKFRLFLQISKYGGEQESLDSTIEELLNLTSEGSSGRDIPVKAIDVELLQAKRDEEINTFSYKMATLITEKKALQNRFQLQIQFV